MNGYSDLFPEISFLSVSGYDRDEIVAALALVLTNEVEAEDAIQEYEQEFGEL